MRSRLLLLVLSTVASLLIAGPAAAQPDPERFPDPHRADQVIVGIEEGAPRTTLAEVEAVTGGRGRAVSTRARTVPVRGSVTETIDRLQQIDGVRYAEPDYIVSIQQSPPLPNDTRFAELWGLHNTGQTGGTADADIDAPEAWRDFTADAGAIVVGTVDTGIRADHEDLDDNLWTNTIGQIGTNPSCGIGTHGFDAVTNSCASTVDPNDHGTHVSGTMGAEGGNGIGITGVAHDVQLMNLRFLAASGSGSTSDAIEALQFALAARQAGVNLVALNNSWGGGGYSQALADVITALDVAGVLFVAAAGNNNRNLEVSDTYPCEYDIPNVVCVASSRSSDLRSGFSNYGATAVDLAAPGSDILSTTAGSSTEYSSFSGTSMATPHVTGAAAVLAARCPGLPPVVARQALMDSVDVLAAWDGVVAAGGRLNLHTLLDDNRDCPPAAVSLSPAAVISQHGTTTTDLVVAFATVGDPVSAATLSGGPTGLTIVAGTPDTSIPGRHTVPVELTAAGDTPTGVHDLDVALQIGADTVHLTVPVEVVAPAVSVSAPGTLTIARGQTVEAPVAVAWSYGYATPASLSATGLPDGIVATFDPPTVDPATPTATVRLQADDRIAVGNPVAVSLAATTPHTAGTAVLSLDRAGGMTATGGTITIPSTKGAAAPYPSTATVGPLDGTVLGVRLHLDGFSHTWPSDVAIALESPAGVMRTVLARAGGSQAVSDLDIVIADGGLVASGATLASLTYAPTVVGAAALSFPAPAPTSTAGTMASFITADPDDMEGTWRLWVQDLVNQDGGSIQGWGVEVAMRPPVIASGAPQADDAVNGGTFGLSWDPSEREVTYDVARRPAAGGLGTPVRTGLADAVTPFTAAAPEDEGRWQYQVTTTRSFDALTATSTWGDEVVVDRTPPGAPTLGTVTPTPVADGAGQLWTATAPTVDVQDTGDPDLSLGVAGSGVDPTTTGPQALAGSGPYAVTVADLTGNASASTPLGVLVDADPPTVAVTGCPQYARLGSVVSVDVATADTGSGIDSTDDPAGSHPVDTSTVGEVIGTWTAHDRVGRSATETCTTQVLDSFLPPGTPTAPAATTGTFDLTWAASEAGATYDVVRQPAAGGAATTLATGLSATSLSFAGATEQPQGRWTYTVTGTGVDGSTAPSSASDTVVVDRTAPAAPTVTLTGQAAVVDPGGTAWVTDPVEATVDATDPDLAPGVPGSGVDPTTTGLRTLLGAGPFDATVADLAGNTSAPSRLEVLVDATAPTVTLTGCPTGTILTGTVTAVDVAMDDVGSGLLDDQTGSHPLDTATIGTRTVSWTATDLVGHTTSASCTYTVAAPGGGGGGGGPVDPVDPTDPGEGPLEPVEEPQVRVPGQDPVTVGVAVSQERFDDVPSAGAGPVTAFAGTGAAHDGTAQVAVLVRDDLFADALAGAPLSATGPLLFTDGMALDPTVLAELRRVLAPGAVVYLLGGEAALSAAVEQAVADAGWVPVRLAGPSRIETALAVADVVVDGGGREVLIARAYGMPDNETAAWADAVTGGAYGADAAVPLLLTPTAGVHPAVGAWLAAHPGLAPAIVGGEAAVGAAVADVLPGAVRHAGGERAATAVAVATGLWDVDGTAYTIVHGWRADGWAFGLAAAGLAADQDAPVLLVDDALPAATAELVGTCVAGPRTLTIVGGLSVIPSGLADSLAAVAASDC